MIQDEIGVKVTPEQNYIKVGLRDNPKRAQLLVSTILGKHIPVNGNATWDACSDLVERIIDATPQSQKYAVMGYAETAVGIGAMVACMLECPFIQSTRIHSPERTPFVTFSESHSHASDHVVYVDNVQDVTGDKSQVLVLVDDEISTGNTVLNTIRAFHAIQARDTYVVVTFVDSRPNNDSFEALAAELDVTIRVVSSVQVAVNLPSDILKRAETVKNRREAITFGQKQTEVTNLAFDYSNSFFEKVTTYGARSSALSGLLAYGAAIAIQLTAAGVPEDAHYLAVEEDMYLPSVTAMFANTTFSSVTRSPAVVIDEEGYPLRSAIEFEKSGEKRWGYNVPTGSVVLFRPLDPAAYNKEEFATLVETLRHHCDELFVLSIDSKDDATTDESNS